MAKKLETLPERRNGAAGRAAKYPYDEWFDGSIWELTNLGDEPDFTSTTRSLSGLARKVATARGLTLAVRIQDDNVVVIQASPKNGDEVVREVPAEPDTQPPAAPESEQEPVTPKPPAKPRVAKPRGAAAAKGAGAKGAATKGK